MLVHSFQYSSQDLLGVLTQAISVSCVFVMYVINKLQVYSLFVAQYSIDFELSVFVNCSNI